VVEGVGERESLVDAHVMVADWSGAGLDFALGLEKPVLFIDLPPKARNDTWQELGIEPLEWSVRDKIGAILPPDRLAEAPARIRQLVRGGARVRHEVRLLRDERVFNLGHSATAGGEAIARLACTRAAAPPAPARVRRDKGGDDIATGSGEAPRAAALAGLVHRGERGVRSADLRAVSLAVRLAGRCDRRRLRAPGLPRSVGVAGARMGVRPRRDACRDVAESPRAVTAVAVSAAAVLLTYLFVDANVFAQYRYHLDVLTAALFEPFTWVMVGVQLLILLGFESLLGRAVGRWAARRPVHASGGRALIAGLAACWLLA